ncbi:ABC transporter ATP-binding protein [Asticcacaulis tiandongensis]|uniref:ABC transporter ATP-binding protein n=1 Tax=Asticcacaulis tiandongensis TaxID=2565365 RepID=UPI00112BA3CF|nr:ABC transporter ATP-binding protein [Asticcacaulis tiandongensis]
MTPLIELKSVDLVYPVYSVRAQSLRNVIANLTVGGKLLRDGSDIIHIQALKQINFSLEENDRLGVIGHNGAGKTTLLKVVAGIYEPTRGSININGNISSMIDVSMGLDPNMTGRENIVHIGKMRGLSTKHILDNMEEIISFSDLGTYIDMPVKIFSSGMQSRLVFAVVTTLNPDILLLDEWLSAGDAAFIDKAKKRIDSLVDKARGLVLASHSTSLIEATCNKLLVLNGGEQVYFGDVNKWDFELAAPKPQLATLIP